VQPTERVRLFATEPVEALVETAATRLDESVGELAVTSIGDTSSVKTAIDSADCIVVGWRSTDGDGPKILQEVQSRDPDLPVFVLLDSEESPSDVLEAGATDYVQRTDAVDPGAVLATRICNALGMRTDDRTGRYQKLRGAETIFQNAQDGIFLIEVTDDDRFVVQRVNPAYEEMSGLSAAEITGKTPSEVLGEELGDDIERHFRECVREKTPLTYEETFDIPGIPTHWNTRIAPVTVDGEVVQIVGATRDITDRKERERKLRMLRDTVETILDNVPMVMFSIDDQGVITQSKGRGFEEIDPWPDETVGESLFELYADHDEIVEKTQRALAGEGGMATIELDGRVLETYYHPVVDDDDEVEQIVGFSLDVTGRVEREQQLELKNRAMDEAPIGITIQDVTEPRNPITYANEGLEQLTGYDETEVRGHDLTLFTGPETDEVYSADIEAAISDLESESVVVLLYRKDGSPFWAQLSVSPVRDEDDEVRNAVSFIQDVTEQKEYEQWIERRFNEFGDVLAEDLREPLREAKASLESLESTDEPGDVQTAEASLRELDDLVTDLTTVYSFSVKSRETSKAARRNTTDPE
jgi:PAS domain S-box-containing protein